MNAWNFKKANSRLEIMQKTEAHRKHLLNLISAKSCIKTHNVLKPRPPLAATLGVLHKKELAKTNQSLVQRIVKISKSHSESQESSGSRSLSRNLKTYSSLSRTLRLKEIEKQNEKLYSRLVLAAPTIKRDQWHKRNIETAKYKQNLHRGKYMSPDYSREACKMIGRLPRFGSTQLLNKTDSMRGKIYQIPKQF